MSAQIFAQHFPKLGPHLTDGTPYTTNLHVFLRPWAGSMNLKNPRVNESGRSIPDNSKYCCICRTVCHVTNIQQNGNIVIEY